MAAITICNDFGAQNIKSDTVSTVSPSICHEVLGPDAMIFVFWMLSFKPTFSLSSFTQNRCLTNISCYYFLQMEKLRPMLTKWLVHNILIFSSKARFQPVSWLLDHFSFHSITVASTFYPKKTAKILRQIWTVFTIPLILPSSWSY